MIDDGSTDGSWHLIEEWFKINKDKIHISSRGLKLHANQGVATAMNTGFDLAKGEYIVSLSDDDYYIKDFKAFSPFMDGKNDLIYFDLEINDGSVWHLDKKSKEQYVGAVKFMRRAFLGDTRVPDLRFREDTPFSQELYAKNPREVFTGIVLKHYNFPHRGSLTWGACDGKL